MQKLLSLMRAACEKYDMLQDGDVVAVGVSGGKDSLVLLAAMNELRRFYPASFTIKAITLDMRFNNMDTDYSEISGLCEGLGIEYIIKRTSLAEVIFNLRKEKNPCSLCAKMRRGILHDTAIENGCNKIALGHHLDDAAETFLMNLFRCGTIGSFRPVTYLSRKDIYLIRPMIFAKETMISSLAEREALPIVKSSCPQDGVSERQSTKELIFQLEKQYPALREKIIGALQRKGIDNW